MSYIRSTSNPEGLYIYGDGEHIIIHHARGTAHVPPRDFERVGLKYLESPALALRRIKSGGLCAPRSHALSWDGEHLLTRSRGSLHGAEAQVVPTRMPP